mmetsp:Transcript_13850/g.27600  ORF Transcript_13850/g.27600 Transcript_13850/m.27600 type:complete len:94 (+) Transcript_13850:2746-3027(+)
MKQTNSANEERETFCRVLRPVKSLSVRSFFFSLTRQLSSSPFFTLPVRLCGLFTSCYLVSFSKQAHRSGRQVKEEGGHMGSCPASTETNEKGR